MLLLDISLLSQLDMRFIMYDPGLFLKDILVSISECKAEMLLGNIQC